MVPGIDPKVDYIFKRLFGREANQALAIHLLNAVLQPPARQRVVELELLNPFNDKDRLNDKLSILSTALTDAREEGQKLGLMGQIHGYERPLRRAQTPAG